MRFGVFVAENAPHIIFVHAFDAEPIGGFIAFDTRWLIKSVAGHESDRMRRGRFANPHIDHFHQRLGRSAEIVDVGEFEVRLKTSFWPSPPC